MAQSLLKTVILRSYASKNTDFLPSSTWHENNCFRDYFSFDGETKNQIYLYMRIDTYIKDFGISVFAEYSRITQTTSLPLPIFPYQQGLFSFVFVFIFHSSLHIFLLLCNFCIYQFFHNYLLPCLPDWLLSG